jgi:hypothetical protein
MFTIPGITYIPEASISWSPSGRLQSGDARLRLMGSTAAISVMVSFSMSMSTGPKGGVPRPLITMAFLITRLS